jgi:hypothetical protein
MNRPSTGRAAKKSKKLALTAPTFISRASSPIPTAILALKNAAACENDDVQAAKSRYRLYWRSLFARSLPLKVVSV